MTILKRFVVTERQFSEIHIGLGEVVYYYLRYVLLELGSMQTTMIKRTGKNTTFVGVIFFIGEVDNAQEIIFQSKPSLRSNKVNSINELEKSVLKKSLS